MELAPVRVVTTGESEGTSVADDKIKVTATEARGGSRGNQVRNVLVAGLLLIVVAFATIYAIYG